MDTDASPNGPKKAKKVDDKSMHEEGDNEKLTAVTGEAQHHRSP